MTFRFFGRYTNYTNNLFLYQCTKGTQRTHEIRSLIHVRQILLNKISMFGFRAER